MSKVTPLAEAQITQSPHNAIAVELVKFDDDMPATVKITWPQQPTVIDPDRFRDTAAALVKLFSEAHVTLARAKVGRLL
jgi:hypothetical protein